MTNDKTLNHTNCDKTITYKGTHPETSEQKSPRWQLVQHILKRSKADTWALAVKEWQLIAIKRSEKPHTCLCTHFPIKELCYLHNDKTDETIKVGNCCVRLFMDAPANLDSVFTALRRGKLNKAVIEYAYEQDIIDDWQYKFSCSTWRRRVLTDKQWAKRVVITERILKELGGREEFRGGFG